MLPDELLALVNRIWGFPELRPLQAQAIRASLSDRDSLVVLPTGGGKSLCYQAPAAYRGGLSVVVSPLIALMKDQVDALARVGVTAVRLDSSQTAAERSNAAELLRRGEVRLAYISPERLIASEGNLLRGAHTVAVDEAHCVSHWGHDFRPEYRQLARVHDLFPGAAVHAYTATATRQVRDDIVAQLRLRDPEILVGNFDRPNLTYRVLPQLNMVAQTREVIDRHRGAGGIVYCLRRKDVDGLTLALTAAGYSAVGYHAGMSNEDRGRAQERFVAEDVDVVVATIAFGMGIDRSNVRFVVHAALPKSIEHYQQETGRAGRDGLPSECVLLFTGADHITLKQIIEKSAGEAGADPEYTAAAIRHLDEMARYARGAVCRHAALVRHFGQKYESPNCAACDLCLGDTDEVPDATLIAQKILSCVARVKEAFGVNHVVEVLRGARTANVINRGHDQLSTYGLLKETSAPDVKDWVYQLVGQDVLAQSGDQYPLLKLNKASWEVMRGERTVRLIRLARHDEQTGSPAPSAGGLPPDADAGLFDVLRSLRRQEASRLAVPPYVVFSDAVLAEFARRRPTTPAQLRQVSGVGDKKLAEFGDTFLRVIVRYCQEHGLKTDVTVAALPPKPRAEPVRRSPNREAAFALFRNGDAVPDAMHRLNLSRSTISDYLADFVRSEKPVSIFGWVPEAVCERVAAAAEEHGRERLKPVFEALNGEVSYEDIRVVFAFLEGQGGG